MNGHTRWETVRRLPDEHGWRIQQAYVDGYLLALEDLLEDMKRINRDDLPGATTFATGAMLREVRVIIARTMKSAQLTKKRLLERGSTMFVCEACKGQEHVQCPGEGFCDCQHREPRSIAPVQ